MKLVSMFLMPHQDDEYGVLYKIEKDIELGKNVYCIYVTDGGATGNVDKREAESRTVLEKLGVNSKNIIFLGRELEIRDGELHINININKLIGWFHLFQKNQSPITTCFVPAWEGGHSDHDILHAITIRFLEKYSIATKVLQFPLYNAFNCPTPFFKVLSPLVLNGHIKKEKIPILRRLRYINLCLSYPSQWRSWLGLFPFVAYNYLFCGNQNLQNVCLDRIKHPPHIGPLYYEVRGFFSWSKMQIALNDIDKEINSSTI